MSPEDQRVWEEDAETEYTEARPATHSPADAEKVPQDVGEVERARVARWEFLVQNTADWWPRQKATAAMRLADEEQAELVAENERLLLLLADETCREEGGRIVVGELMDARRRAESAEAEVERLRVRLAKVEALHVVAVNAIPPDAPDWCVACGRTWPCPTIAALADAPTEQTLDRGDLPTDGVFTVGADTYDPDMTDDLEGDGFGLDQL